MENNEKNKKQNEPIKREVYISHMTKAISISIASALVVGGLTSGLIVYSRYKIYDDPGIQKIIKTYEIMVDDWYFGGSTVSDDVINGALSGMTSQGDRYTVYTSTFEEQGLSTIQYGLGFKYIYYGGNVYVNYVYPMSPAYNAGLRTGDVISEAYYNNSWVALNTLSYNDLITAVENANENNISFKVTHSEESTLTEISYVRDKYSYAGAKIESYNIVDDKLICNIKVDTFLDSSLDYTVKTILSEVEETTGKQIYQLNIDLRDNGGGYVSEAIDLCSLFVPKDTIVLQYEYKDGSIEKYSTTKNPSFSHIQKFTIVQNKGTASASESFILAMKHLKNTTIIGQTSYGKGIVQTLYYFNDGSVLRYTIAKSAFPISINESVCIHGVGIETDDNYNYNNVFYYWGEADFSSYTAEKLVEAYKIIVDEINLVMSTNYENYEEAITAYQNAESLTVTGEMNKETGDYLQKQLYDYYLNQIEYVTTTLRE